MKYCIGNCSARRTSVCNVMCCCCNHPSSFRLYICAGAAIVILVRAQIMYYYCLCATQRAYICVCVLAEDERYIMYIWLVCGGKCGASGLLHTECERKKILFSPRISTLLYMRMLYILSLICYFYFFLQLPIHTQFIVYMYYMKLYVIQAHQHDNNDIKELISPQKIHHSFFGWAVSALPHHHFPPFKLVVSCCSLLHA